MSSSRPRSLFVAFAAALVFGLLMGCRAVAGEPRTGSINAPLILISLDGFRWDYCDLHPNETPNLRRLRTNGVSARGLVPVFPTNTFPNHYTLVTGLYPSQHGMINNEFFDPQLGEFFRYTQPASAGDSRWWGGEPIWVTAIKQGRKAATSFWVGSEAEIGGVRPNFWQKYDAKLEFEPRLEEMLGWLRLPLTQRPDFIAFYLEETNGAGHRFGPDSREVVAAISLLDTRVGTLLTRLDREGLKPNVVIVADHGMVAVDRTRASALEDYLNLQDVQVEFQGSVVGLRPLNNKVDTLLAAAVQIPHAKAYRVDELPPHFQMRDNPRLSPVWIIPDEGAHVATRATIERFRARYPEQGYLPGDHGYDPAITGMHGLFIAHGPAFQEGVTLPQVESIHLYNLLCAVLGIKPAPNAGDDRLAKTALRPRS